MGSISYNKLIRKVTMIESHKELEGIVPEEYRKRIRDNYGVTPLAITVEVGDGTTYSNTLLPFHKGDRIFLASYVRINPEEVVSLLDLGLSVCLIEKDGDYQEFYGLFASTPDAYINADIFDEVK